MQPEAQLALSGKSLRDRRIKWIHLFSEVGYPIKPESDGGYPRWGTPPEQGTPPSGMDLAGVHQNCWRTHWSGYPSPLWDRSDVYASDTCDPDIDFPSY